MPVEIALGTNIVRKAEPENSSADADEATASPDRDSAVEEAETIEVETDQDSGSAERSEVTAGSRTGGAGVRDRIVSLSDKLAMLSLKAVAFGVVAAAAGVLATMILRNYETQNSTDELARELALRDARMAELEDSLSSLSERFAPLTVGDEVTALADGIEQGQGETNRNLVRIEAALTSTAEELGQRIDGLESRLTELEQLPDPPSIQPDGSVPADPPVNMAAIEARLDALSGKLTALEAGAPAPADAAETSAEIESLEARISGIESRVAAIPAGADLERSLAETEQRLADLESGQAGESLPAKSFALIGIRAAAATGAPYLRLLRDAGYADVEIPEVVMIHAETGVATVAELQRSFGGYAREALKASNAQLDGEGGVLSLLSSLIQVRPLTPQEGDDAAATLSRAEASLMAGDLRAALMTLATLPDPAQEALADWTLEGEAHIAVLAAIDTMLERPETEQ